MNLFLTFLFMFTQNLLLALYPVVRDFRPYKRISGHDIRGTPQQIQEDLEASLQSRIAYGSPASIEEFPYFASLRNCGAVIISDRWVLTAAHCFGGVPRRNNYLWVGGESIEKSFKVTYDKIVIHPWYYIVETMIMNDVALLRLTEPLKFSEKIRPIELYDGDLDQYDENDSNENNNYKLHYWHEYIGYALNSNSAEYNFEEASDGHARNYVDSYSDSHEDDSDSHSDEDDSDSHSDEDDSDSYSDEDDSDSHSDEDDSDSHSDEDDSDSHSDEDDFDSHSDEDDSDSHSDEDDSDSHSDENDSDSHSDEDDSDSHSDEDFSHHSDKLISHGFERKNNRLVLVGRGLDENKQLPENISTMEMFYYPADACYAKFYTTYYSYAKPFLPLINIMFLCGVRAKDLIGAGKGDSGSPVVKGNKLVGIASHLMTNKATHSRVVFLTNVASYVPWIKSVTGL